MFISLLAFCSIIIVFLFLSFLENKFTYKMKKNLILLLVIITSIMCGIRVVGLDLEPYRDIFNRSNILGMTSESFQILLSSSIEPFFLILISTLKSMGLGFKTFLFISAFIPFFIVYKLITKKENILPFVTFLFLLLILLFRGPIDTIRSFFAAVLYLSSIYALSENKKMKFYGINLFSILVHYSNVATLLIRPFLKIKWSIAKYIATLIIVFVIAFISKDLLINYISNKHFSNVVLFKFQHYLLYYQESYVYLSELHKVLLFLMTSYVPIVAFGVNIFALQYRNTIAKDKFYHLLLNSQIIGSILLVIFVVFDASTIGLRLNFLFSIGCFFLMKELIFKYYKGKRLNLFVIIVVILGLYNLILLLYTLGIHNPNSPYSLVG